MARIVKLLSILAFGAQCAFLWRTMDQRDIESGILVSLLSSMLLVPFCTASADRPRMNGALLAAFIPAGLIAVWVITVPVTATNSTAALAILAIWYGQGFVFTVALAIGVNWRKLIEDGRKSLDESGGT